MFKLPIFLFLLFWFSFAYSNNPWVGAWIALDKWQSEFRIIIDDDGGAKTDYGSGDNGKWKIVDGNLEIFWKSGKKDYFFNGVMGYQRISKSKNESYTSGIKKLSD